jgi:hypothetical protein
MNVKGMIALISLAMLVGLIVAPAGTAPKPNEAPMTWEIDIRYETPKSVMVKTPGQEQPQRFWYFLYTATNRSGEDHDFVPEIILYTNTGQVVRAGRGVNPAVYQTLKKIINDPLLTDTVGITGKLLQGEDNARTAVAIFRDFDPKAASFTLFFGGLSGETAVVHLPRPIQAPDPLVEGKTIETSTVTLTKTLALDYNVGSEAGARNKADVRLIKKSWVMR